MELLIGAVMLLAMLGLVSLNRKKKYFNEPLDDQNLGI